MTNQMIPYSFIPGTKAKASEVNANFISVANAIEKNNSDVSHDIDEINGKVKEITDTKADKTELITEHDVEEPATDLNDYKTKGTYIFTSETAPSNSPSEGAEGILFVTGTDTAVKQIWFSYGENSEIYTRSFKDESWSAWSSNTGNINLANPGYLEMPNGLLIQWGNKSSGSVTYPIAFNTVGSPVCAKNGQSSSFSRSDTGISSQSLTGFSLASAGVFSSQNWVAFGY